MYNCDSPKKNEKSQRTSQRINWFFLVGSFTKIASSLRILKYRFFHFEIFKELESVFL